MTKGWKLCVKWHDGSTSWERLADLTELYPIEVAEFATAHALHNEAAFMWWIPYVLARCKRIIAAENRCYHKCTHKYGSKSQRRLMIAYELTTKMAILFDRIPSTKKCLTSLSHSRYLRAMKPYLQHTKKYDVIWYMILKWRISGGRLGLLQEAI
jgi:hypothetical protein